MTVIHGAKVDVTDPAQALAVVAQVPVRELVRIPAREVARIPAKTPVRDVTISALLLVLSLVQVVVDVLVAEILVVLDARIAAWEPAKAIVLEDAELAVEDALHPAHQAVRVIAVELVKISALDRQQRQYIQFRRLK